MGLLGGVAPSLMIMQGTDLVSVPRQARQLEMDGVHIYELLFAGLIKGGPDADGSVRVSLASIRDYLRREPAVG